ncbi:hypothetical protein [Halorussus salinisoli]|uniref:hypothetical protein n=1 Tax=Halorussus salinisoli TaxID=2558242 RepID=UPI0010C2160D|nr:hypothetical protein [Halorussus salinisoli]
MPSYEEIVEEVRAFFDIYNKIFVVGSVLVVGLLVYLQAPLSAAVAIFTAVYAFIAFNRMRDSEGVWTNSPVVRRDFQSSTDSDSYDFGLRNFGPGPALYLRVHATVEPDGPSLTIPESDPPLHLEEGEFLSLIQDELAVLRDENSDLYEKDDAARVELYYTFESTSGRQTPPGLKNPRDMSVDDLVDKADNPRTEKLENLRKVCTEVSEVAEEPTL